MKNNFPVDIVITWVDGNDKEWIKSRNSFLANPDKRQNSISGDDRYDENVFLKYLFNIVLFTCMQSEHPDLS